MPGRTDRLSRSFGRLYWSIHRLQEEAVAAGAEPLASMCDDLKSRVWLLGLSARAIAGALDRRREGVTP